MTDQQRPTSPQAAFQELARISLADHDLDSVMQKVAALTKSTVPGAHEVSVTLTERGHCRTVAFTGRLAIDLDERQYDKGYGPCLSAIDGGTTIVINNMAAERRWPDWTAEAVKQGACSSLSIPLPLQPEVFTALNIYSADQDAFDEGSVEIGESFASYAAVTLLNTHLYEGQSVAARQLREAMESRAVIEQAKGILMGERRCNAQQAFDLLVKLSQSSNRKLRDVAQTLVDQADQT